MSSAKAFTSTPSSAPSIVIIGLEFHRQVRKNRTAYNLSTYIHAAGYKHVVLELIFLKYISHTFEEYRAKLHQSRASVMLLWKLLSVADDALGGEG